MRYNICCILTYFYRIHILAGKSIKKTIKIVFVFVLIVLSLPTITYFVIQNNKVQQYLVHNLSGKLSEVFGETITMESANLDLFSNFHFKRFLILDKKNDTLLFAPELIIKPSSFTIFFRFVEINKIILKQPDINLRIDSAGVINLHNIVEKLASKDSTKAGWLLSFRELEIQNAHFRLKNAHYAKREFGVNFSDLDLNPLNITVAGLRTTGNGVEIKIRKFSAYDHSGFKITNLSARLKINKNNLVFDDLELEMPNSTMEADQIAMNFSKWKNLSAPTIFKEVNFNLEINKSSLSTSDLAYLIPKLKLYNLSIKLKGDISGQINNIKAKNIEIEYGKRTTLKGNFDINGLPDIANTFLHISIKNFLTNPTDIESINLPGLNQRHIVLPSNFKQISFINYKGKFTGFLSDFVAYGTINTNLGSLESDLSFRPDTSKYFVFNGKIKMNQFQLGTFLSKQDVFGPISLNALANGKITGTKDYVLNIDGQVYSFIFKKYNYQNIKIDGKITNKIFDGKLSVFDPNIDLAFNGNVNFTDSVPVFNFIANVKNANLFKLHLDEKDSSSTASFYATANFEGNNIDNLKGEIKLWNSQFTKTGKQIQINDFLLFTQTVNDTNCLILRSSIADAEIWGTYRFKELASSFKYIARSYFPSLISNISSDDSIYDSNFRFEINFKETRQLTDFLIPDLYISTDSKLTGKYYPQKHKLNFVFQVPLLQHKLRKWYNVYFNGSANRDSFSLISGCKNLKITNDLNFENFSVYSSFKNDSTTIDFRWNNWDTISYKGNFSINGLISKKHNKPAVQFYVKPSTLVLRDTIWNIATGNIVADSTGVVVKGFELWRNNQIVKASGKISNQKDDHLVIEFINLDLGNLKTIYSPKKIAISGIVNGKAQFSDFFTNPLIYSSVTIDSLSINNQVIGNTNINANWNSNDKNIFIYANSFRNNLKTFTAKGRYFIETKDIDFDVAFNKLKLDLFEPFLSGIFSNVQGAASGKLSITGKSAMPYINGEIKTHKAIFVVNYLKTKYNFSNTIYIKNNSFVFRSIEVFDDRNNRALLNGTIEFEKLKNLNIDLKIDAANLECLNTTEKDNSLFYGTGYASGLVKIKGTAPNIQMDIVATTNRNTAIFIPLLLKSEIAKSNFIRMVQKVQSEDPYAKYEIDKREITQDATSINPGLTLNLNLKVTPDADVQIVFDQKIGDFIQGTGNGNFNIFLEGGRFSMFGIYTIERGEYLFTLQNIINKKFKVKQGGTILWNGDPIDAQVNLEANYRVKASLYDLITGNEDDKEKYKKRIPIDCRLWITGKLMNPTIRYDIDLPSTDQDTRTLVENAINNDEERSKQFLSLLILNSFFKSNQETMNSTQESSTGINAAGVTGIEFMSNQLSHWLSQISKDFDVGVNYHPGDEITNQEVEVALSTQILNDRVIIDGNVDVGVENQTQTSNKNNNIVGDFTVEYKFTDNGKVRMKVFNRSNESSFDLYSSPYTQGIGLFYKEEFNTLQELLNTYYKVLFKRKSKETITPIDSINEEYDLEYLNDSISGEAAVNFLKK